MNLKNRIKILIADDNLEICDSLAEFFKGFNDIVVCGIAKNGLEAVEKIFKFCPDVVILDMMMPMGDGIYVLSEINEKYKENIQIIIYTSNWNDIVIRRAINLGASHALIKPTPMQCILDWVRYFYENKKDKTLSLKANRLNIDLMIKRKIMEVGVPTNHLGYYYMVEALKIILKSNSICFYSEIYEKVAQSQNTTFKCVESAIRNAATYAFKNCNDDYKTLFLKDNETGKPTNAKFLSTLAEEIKVNVLP